MKDDPNASGSEQTSELLILNDGNILVHNLTRTMAELLAELNPEDATMRQRARPEAGATIRDISADRHSL
jgi:hypothetical protein